MTDIQQLLTEHMDIWTAAESEKKSGRGRVSGNAGCVYGIKKLHQLILELAVRGKLVPQDPNDEPASELLKRIQTENAKPYAPITENEKPFELPTGWEWVYFGEIAQHNSGKTLDKGRNKGVLRDYITTSNLYWGEFELDNVKQMPIEESELERCTAKKGDLLICEGGEAGRAAVWAFDKEVCFQNHVHRARMYQNISPFYAYRYFEKLNATGEIENYRKGVGISNMSGKALASVIFALPPLAEQHRIVAKVDELMALCDQLEQQHSNAQQAHETLVSQLLATLTQPNKTTPPFNQRGAGGDLDWQRIYAHFDVLFTTEASIDALKQTLLQLAVMGKLVPQDPNDKPASELLQRIQAEKTKLIAEGKLKKEKPLTPISDDEKPFELPKGWEWVKVQQVFNVISGTSFDRASEKESGKYIYLKVADMNIEDNEIEITTSSRFVNPSDKELNGIIPSNSIIFPKRGGAIATNKKRLVVTDIFVDLNIMAITVPKLISLHYVFQWLLGIDLAKLNTGTSVPQINHQDIDPLIFPLPPLIEQHNIVAKVCEFMTLCDQLKARIQQANQQQQAIANALVAQAVA